MPAVPQLGFTFVDVRDVADLHIRAMTDPAAGGQRFIAIDRFLWMARGRGDPARAPRRRRAQGPDARRAEPR